MAYTIPSGYQYYDSSAQTYYQAGQSFSGTPGVGDNMTPVPSGSGPYYFYRDSYERNPRIYVSGDPLINVSAGWHADTYNTTATTISFLSNIAGVNIVEVDIDTTDEGSRVTTVTNIPTAVQCFVVHSNILTTIQGTMPNTLKYFNAYGASALTTIPSLANCTQWINGYGAFRDCVSLTTAPAIPNTLQILDQIFYNCTSLITALNIPSSAIRAGSAYYNCSKITTAPLNNSTSLTSIACCFQNCTSMTTAENFTIRGVNSLNAREIFSGCTALQTGPTIVSTNNLNNAFRNCISLVASPDLSGVSSGTDLLNCKGTFEGCTSLTTIPQLPEHIGSMEKMFSGCISLQPQNIYIPHSVTDLNNCFASVPNLAGIVTLDRNISAIFNAFNNATGPIVITGSNTLGSNDLLQMGPNVYKELEIEPDTITTVRCSDTNGTLADDGNYIKLTAHFTSITLPNTKVYVPKVYIKTDQQEPVVDWKLTNNTTQTTTTIADSTDVSVTRIEAGDLIADGTFESYFTLGEDEVVNYKIYIATSAPNVYEWDELESTVQTITKYWNGLPGSSIFTSSTFIFDATPDGNSFKIGGPIQDNEEEGFIVGNRGLPLLADQYPSTFNGPVTINSLVNIKQFADLEDNNSLYALSISQNNLNNYTNTLTADWDGNLSANGDITANGDIIDSTGRAMSEIPNIHISTSAPTSSDGEDGDIWITYTA